MAQEAALLPWREPVASLNILLTSTCWRNDHNGFSHQGPGLIDMMLSKKGTVTRIYLPPDANCLLSVADHCLRSADYVNLIVIDKQPQLQWLNMAGRIEHCARGASIWHWASNDEGGGTRCGAGCGGRHSHHGDPGGGAVASQRRIPELKVRVVNVVDLMTLFPPDHHPHGMDETAFVDLFTARQPVVFAFHGYQRAVHEIIHGRRQCGALPRAWLQRGGDHHHALRHGGAQ